MRKLLFGLVLLVGCTGTLSGRYPYQGPPSVNPSLRQITRSYYSQVYGWTFRKIAVIHNPLPRPVLIDMNCGASFWRGYEIPPLTIQMFDLSYYDSICSFTWRFE